MKLRNKLIRGLAYTFAFGLVTVSLLTRKSYAMDVRPESVPAQVMPKQEFQPTIGKLVLEQDDTRQTDTITAALQGKASPSASPLQRGGQTQDDVMRRTTSSNISIGPKESGFLEEKASPEQSDKAVLEQPQQGEQVLTGAPEVQQMTGGVPGISSGNPSTGSGVSSSVRKRAMPAPEASRPFLSTSPVGLKGLGGARTPTQTPRGQEAGYVGSLSERAGGSDQYSKRENCSPCSEPIVNCCQNLFRGRMSIAGRSSTPPALPMGSFPRSSTPTLASANPEGSTSGSNLQWNNRPIADLLNEYSSKPTQAERDQFYLDCADRVDPPKMDQFSEAVTSREEYQRMMGNSAALARGIEIDRNIKNSHLLADTAPAEGFPEGTSRDYRATNYHENVPWQLRIVPNDGTRITPPDIYFYHNMQSHAGDITMDHVRSEQRKVEKCRPEVKKAQEKGRRKLMEVAINKKDGNIRTLPIGENEEQSVQYIVSILEASPDCKFSAEKTTVARVKKAYGILGKGWPKLEDTPISTSLPPSLFSVGRDNVLKGSEPSNWVGTKRSGNTKSRDLKMITASIKYRGGEAVEMILVNPDKSHVDFHFEAYDHNGFYLGKLDKDTVLLCAESIPKPERVAVQA